MNLGTIKINTAFGDIATFCLKQVGDCFKSGCFTGSVGTQNCNNTPLWNIQRDTLEYKDNMVVYDLNIVNA